jgi:4-amino-4-deoxy-L-arabinose transferase-like glycosyltransferase
VKNVREKLIIGLIILFALLVRVWGINKVPVSLFGDELDVGYQAYSILNTGKDYMGNSWPMHLQSLAEYRTPLYIYSVVPTVMVFGITPLGVRLPAAIFGLLGVIFTYFLVLEITKNKKISIIALAVIALSSWHIHYSRAGFEVTLLYALFTLGLLTFLKSFKNPKQLILSALSFGLTPWVYSTAKLYLPMTLLFLLIVWWKDIFKISKKYLAISSVLFLILIVPYGINTLKGGGVDRFNLISIFGDNTMEIVVGEERQLDTYNLNPFSKLQTRVLHNKYIFWIKSFYVNYTKAFSTDFLLISGDGNIRHNPTGMGTIYFIDFAMFLAGIYFLFTKVNYDKKIKTLILFLLFTSPVSSALTVSGGNHATRLFMMILPLTILISIGIIGFYDLVKSNIKRGYVLLIVFIYIFSFYLFQHYYWNHYPTISEKMWNMGWKTTISEILDNADSYDEIVISGYKDASLIYFLSWGEYPPQLFQEEIRNESVKCGGYGNCKKFGKYLFPEIGSGVGLYEMGKVLEKNTLYVVPFEQVKFDLSKEPNRVPNDLKLIFTSNYASGSPAFYAFTRKDN